MVARHTTHLLILMVFSMIILGGIVHGTGSSLACPDWPLCYGQLMPEMKGGILFEHSHRLLGAAVGVGMVILSIGLFSLDRQRMHGGSAFWVGLVTVAIQFVVLRLRGPLWVQLALVLTVLGLVYVLYGSGMRLTAIGLLGVEIVSFQGLLGGLTVIYRLPPLVSTLHLSTAMILLAGLVLLAFRLGAAPILGASIAPRRLLLVSIWVVFAQIVLGAFMRHTGSTLACGAELFSCQGGVFGAGAAAHTAFLHRWFAFVVMGTVIVATLPFFRAARACGRGWVRLLAASSHALLVVQIGLGFLALVNYVPVSLATAHQGVAAVLLANLCALHAVSGPLGNRFDGSNQSAEQNLLLGVV